MQLHFSPTTASLARALKLLVTAYVYNSILALAKNASHSERLHALKLVPVIPRHSCIFFLSQLPFSTSSPLDCLPRLPPHPPDAMSSRPDPPSPAAPA